MSTQRKDRSRSERQAALTQQHLAAKAARAGGSSHCKRWTDEDDKILRLSWGEVTLQTIAKRLGRKPGAVRCRAWALKLGGAGERSGLLSVFEIAERTGYAESRIARAVARLSLVPHRKPTTTGRTSSVRGFDEDDVAKLEAFLATVPDAVRLFADPEKQTASGEWGKAGKPAACLKCGRSDRPHHAGGLCRTCDGRKRHDARAWGAGACLSACEKCSRSDSPPATTRFCKRCLNREAMRRHRAKRAGAKEAA